MKSFNENYKMVLTEIDKALGSVKEEQVVALVDAIIEAEQVFVVGVGRVMLSLQAMAKRLAHLGIPTHCVGDITEPAITDKDLLIVGSGSGSSVVPVAIANVATKHKPKIAHIGSNANSPLAPITDIFVRIPVQTKLNLDDEIKSNQIMSSLFEQSLYLLADSVALMIAEKKNIDDLKKLWKCHANLE